MKLSEELIYRGFVAETTIEKPEDLDNRESKKFYWGADPSADSLTIGNLAALMMCACFVRHGYEPYLLVGGATGQIGDPKENGERDLKTLEEVDHNKNCIREQIECFSNAAFTFDQKIEEQVQGHLFKDLYEPGEKLPKGDVTVRTTSTGTILFTEGVQFQEVFDEKSKNPRIGNFKIILSANFAAFCQQHAVPINYSVYKDIIEELLDTLAENECWSREEIKEYIKEMEEKSEFKGKRISQRDVSREYLLPTCNYGLWFTDISADFKSGLTGISDKIIAASEKTGMEISTDNMVPFVETLKGMQRFMGKEVKEEEKKGTDRQEHTDLKMAKTDALYVDSSSGVTRTKLLTAFYYLFNARYADDFGECGMSFREVFDMFSEEVRPYLEDAYYPAIDPKNIFDVLLIFSSYSYLNMG